MFELRGVDKRFDAVVALNNASLNVKPGEVHALLGSNGSGKSTMIKILAGLVNPNAGEILIDGSPVEIRNGYDSRKLGIATAFQDLSLIPTMSVRDNILLGNEPKNALGLVDQRASDEIISRLLERFQIDCDPDDYVQTLMPSTQTMLEVAKAVALKPRLLLLDEVTAALHYDEIQVLFSVMRELKEEGIAMVYVTHRMNEVFEVCDRTTIMRSGESVITGPMDDFSLDDIVYYMTGQRPDKSKKDVVHSHSDGGREIVLDVKNLSIFPKVHDISLRAHKGEIVGIGGLQGQGQRIISLKKKSK
jgi:ribose transport system ATP-binding protein